MAGRHLSHRGRTRAGDRDDLPSGYERVLPKAAKCPLQGYSDVFGLAQAFVAYTDSRFDPETLR